MRADEVAQIIDLGADRIVVSNHGGRNLDSGQASVLVLPEVAEAADGRIEVFVNGGIRVGRTSAPSAEHWAAAATASIEQTLR